MSALLAAAGEAAPQSPGTEAQNAAPAQNPAMAAAPRGQIDAEVFARLSHLFRRAGTGATTQSLFGALYEARTARRKEA